jgi:hypothetical protein
MDIVANMKNLTEIVAEVIFSQGETGLYLTDWADTDVMVTYVNPKCCFYSTFTYREGRKLAKAIRKMVEKIHDWDFTYVKCQPDHHIKVECQDGKIEIGFYADHNVNFLWLAGKSALKLASKIDGIVQGAKEQGRY